MKKDGGRIKNWQLHTLSNAVTALSKAKELNPDFNMNSISVFTGTVIDDPTGRWKTGFHMRSSLVLTFDVKHGIIETQNTLYKLEGEQGDIMGDLGIKVLNIFY